MNANMLTMSSSEMLTLTTYFGILLGDLVPENEPSWIFYAIILEILEILLGRFFSKVKIEYLQTLIEQHHILFRQIFNTHLKPKYHFLLHYPRIIVLIGPPRNFWAMRFEAYHKLLKCTAKAVTSRKNLLITMCIKDSLRFSNRLMNKKGFDDNMKV